MFVILQDMPKELQPAFILGVEKEELFIQAGLQDRVIQVDIFKGPFLNTLR